MKHTAGYVESNPPISPGIENVLPRAGGYRCAEALAAEILLEQALALPVEERALLASGLLASLDSEALDEAEVERLWSAETERRVLQLDTGESELVTWDHVLHHIDERRS